MEKENILFENQFLKIKMINSNYPFLIMKKNGVVVVPYDKDENVYLIYRNRENIGDYYELPRGFVENKESYMAGAVRELIEETGIKLRKVTELGSLQPDTGICENNIKTIALLVEETKNHDHFDDHDNSKNKVVKLSKDEIMQLIASGQIVCSLTLSTLLKFYSTIKF